MERYNYLEAVTNDVRDYVAENMEWIKDYADDRERLEEEMNDELFTDDRVTGNASGSYWCNTWKAEECLAHNLDEIVEVASEYGFEPIISSGWEHGAEWWDVNIRCYHLSEAIAIVLDELEETGFFDTEEDAEEDAEAI